MNQTQTLRALLVASSLAVAAVAALAQGPVNRGAVESQFKADRQVCMTGQTVQASRDACLYDARLARQAALTGQLGGETPATLKRNRLLRCDAVTPGSEDECLRAMNGEGDVTGSVKEGAIVRELVLVEPVPAPKPL